MRCPDCGSDETGSIDDSHRDWEKYRCADCRFEWWAPAVD